MTDTSAGRKGAHRRTAVLLFLALLAIIPGTELGYAQATLRGRVVDSELGNPLPAAAVRIRGGPEGVVTDTLGVFEVQLPSGQAELNIQLIGYAPGIFMVQVPAAGVFERTFAMDFNGNRLPEQVVRARAERLTPRYVDFEQRRQRKLGAFLRWDELERQGAGSVGDALRKVRGVRIKCDQQTFECFAYMSRTPTCQPTWWVDGVEVRSFHENTPIRDVYGVEIYRGAGEVPGEFSGSNAACGVIVIWTKSRPFK
ncbi:MAG TPA: carboxypeptidase-like regulatory domain-containing protein [Gemmatimonadaceae bacterium]|nr:carboxypeptidase-like regulatory domain-containing protein [Gemmatimonadaceae bacterium]